MKDVRFEIFVKSEKKYISFANILFIIQLFSLFLAWVLFDTKWFEPFTYFFFTVVIIGLFLSFRSYFVYENLNGTIKGSILFSSDEIKVNNTIYPINDISKINFKILDYYNEVTYGLTRWEGRISNGVNNYVKFNLKSKQEIKTFFQLEKFEILKLKKLLFYYYNLGKISSKQCSKILDMNEKDFLKLQTNLRK